MKIFWTQWWWLDNSGDIVKPKKLCWKGILWHVNFLVKHYEKINQKNVEDDWREGWDAKNLK